MGLLALTPFKYRVTEKRRVGNVVCLFGIIIIEVTINIFFGLCLKCTDIYKMILHSNGQYLYFK